MRRDQETPSLTSGQMDEQARIREAMSAYYRRRAERERQDGRRVWIWAVCIVGASALLTWLVMTH